MGKPGVGLLMVGRAAYSPLFAWAVLIPASFLNIQLKMQVFWRGFA